MERKNFSTREKNSSETKEVFFGKYQMAPNQWPKAYVIDELSKDDINPS